MNPYDPSNYPRRYDIWYSPGVEKFNYCYVFDYYLKTLIMEWSAVTPAAIVDYQERVDDYGHLGDDIMLVGLCDTVVDNSGEYLQYLTLYSITDDWEVINRLKGGEPYGLLGIRLHSKHKRPLDLITK